MQFKTKQNHEECQAECKDLDDQSSCKNDYMQSSSTCDCRFNKSCKIDKYLDNKNCSWKKRLFGKLVLVCKDEILYKTESSLDDKKHVKKKLPCSHYSIGN